MSRLRANEHEWRIRRYRPLTRWQRFEHHVEDVLAVLALIAFFVALTSGIPT